VEKGERKEKDNREKWKVESGKRIEYRE